MTDDEFRALVARLSAPGEGAPLRAVADALAAAAPADVAADAERAAREARDGAP